MRREQILLNAERLPPDIISTIRYKRKLFRLFHKRPSENRKQQINNLQKEIKYKIAQFREQKNNIYISILNENFYKNKNKKKWKTLSSRRGKYSGHNIPSKLDDKTIASDQAFIDILHSKFKDRIGTDPPSSKDKLELEIQETTTKIKSIINHFEDITDLDRHFGNTSILLDDISQDQMIKIIKKKNNTAAGPDGIPFIALQKGPPTLYHLLTRLFNASIKFGYIPQTWKTVTIFIPTPNKSRFSSANYRPITLTNTIANICETVVSKRLNLYLEESNVAKMTLQQQLTNLHNLGSLQTILHIGLLQKR